MTETQILLGNENYFVCSKCKQPLPFQRVDVNNVTHHIGYVETPEGLYCYNCQVVHELEDMRDRGKAVMYLVGMKVVNYARTLQFDVDGDIKFITAKLSRKREYQKIRLHFIGPDGARWVGSGFNSQRLTCVRMKMQKKGISPLNPETYIVHYNYA